MINKTSSVRGSDYFFVLVNAGYEGKNMVASQAICQTGEMEMASEQLAKGVKTRMNTVWFSL